MNTTAERKKQAMLGIPQVMQIVGIGRDKARELMMELNAVELGTRLKIHEDVLNSWLKGNYKK